MTIDEKIDKMMTMAGKARQLSNLATTLRNFRIELRNTGEVWLMVSGSVMSVPSPPGHNSALYNDLCDAILPIIQKYAARADQMAADVIGGECDLIFVDEQKGIQDV